ncbi:nucleotidyltransferase family protein [Allomesorhizobium camelthorni]|uniref:Nucleotidyltransferase domain-containing protein n=1 Tax=Allomesorhizobium camelthorni TaxID=475069 RepID=A0A6G4WLP3_9HYPH|nr:nucleotidyltransferase domain-containing protein [Mesorhizobium camelthorni]NGO55126.1 nucleotidyltransferase domain-containing protein [Mesorhizobium camelthorni]
MQRDVLVQKLKTLRPDLSVEGVTHVALFGSRARGDYSEQSDLDLLLEVDLASRFSILNLVGVERIVEKATGIPANAFMRRSLDDSFRDSIKNDVVEIF